MRALVIKCASEKIRYDLFSVGEELESLVVGRITDIGEENPQHFYQYGERGRAEGSTMAANHAEAFERLAAVLRSPTTGREDYTQNLAVVSHRVPHGGMRFKGPELISDDILQEVDALSPFAPRANPSSIMGIQAAMNLFSGAPHVAVFDTSFFQSLPPEAHIYPLPREYYDEYGLRRFGFHGTSHRYAIGTAAAEMGSFPEALRIVSLHLGEEGSAVAFDEGRCADVTTGLSAQNGLPGSTTAGTIDPAALTYLMRTSNLGPDEVDYLLARQSGILGLSGVSANLIDVLEQASKGDARCEDTIKIYVRLAIKAVGSLVAVMGGLDLLVFTGSAGEKSSRLRTDICDQLGFLSLELDSFRNDRCDGSKLAEVSNGESKVKVYVVPGEEERTIVRESVALVNSSEEG